MLTTFNTLRDPTGFGRRERNRLVKMFKLVAALLPALALFGCSDDSSGGLTGERSGCITNWQDPTGQSMCPEGTTVSCNQATQCWATVDECEASGQCTSTNPNPGTCDPNWQDPTGQAECPQGAPVSCNAANQCWPTVDECQASGQCN